MGDQILTVNDIDVTSLTHDEAVDLLQSHPHMSLLVRSEGKVPHSTVSPYGSNAAMPGTSSQGGGAGPPTSPSGWYGEPPPTLNSRTE